MEIAVLAVWAVVTVCYFAGWFPWQDDGTTRGERIADAARRIPGSFSREGQRPHSRRAR